MILIKGKLQPNRDQAKIIDTLQAEINHTLNHTQPLTPNIVIDACDQLLRKVLDHHFDEVLMPLLDQLDISYEMFLQHARLFSKEGLSRKVEVELGVKEHERRSLDNQTTVERYPLGVLLHIAAGNVDGLPAYSVVEGLLAGNINLLKLPSSDQGLSIMLLSALIEIEPRLTEYIYVFDVPSRELESLKKLAAYSDAVIVWGGDEAIKAARDFCPINTKIISWGHKLSFAYCDVAVRDEDLRHLAKSICSSNQLLCSSVQGIYLDTDNPNEQLDFAKRFFTLFKEVNAKSHQAPIGMRGKNTISIYNEQLERGNKQGIFHEDGISVLTYDDEALTLSMMYRNVWVKRLPRKDIIRVLKPYKNYLQSVGVSVRRDHEEEVKNALAKAGLVRITALGETSRMIAGEAHDGDYPLRLYSRMVEIDRKNDKE